MLSVDDKFEVIRWTRTLSPRSAAATTFWPPLVTLLMSIPFLADGGVLIRGSSTNLDLSGLAKSAPVALGNANHAELGFDRRKGLLDG